MQNHVTLEWADGSYDFKLPWAACSDIEQKSNAGIQVIYERMMAGQAHLADVSEIIRQGLLGGSGGEVDGQTVECKPVVVNRLIERYVTGPDRRPFAENWAVAQVVLHGFMHGYEPSEGAKKKAESEAGTTAST